MAKDCVSILTEKEIRMMRLFKFFSFWLTLFSLSICLFNLAGYNDKNLLLFFTSPILWFLEDYSSFLMRFISYQSLIWLDYFLNIYFWCYVGLFIDSIVHASKRKKIKVYLIRIGIISFVFFLLSVMFYTFHNTEKAISNILRHPDKYNEQTVLLAVNKSAEEGYEDKYIDEMEMILQKTKSKDVFISVVSVLGRIGTPQSIKMIIENYNGDPTTISYSLASNENTVISMLDLNQSQDMISAGIEAAKFLGFSSFIQPLRNIENNHPNKEIQEKASAVLQQLNLNPKKNNPKFNID